PPPANFDDLGEIDKEIIAYLQKNGRESYAKIGEEIGVPASTVRDRTKRLVDHGILRIVGVLNPIKGGKKVMANMGIKISGGDHREIAAEIAKLEDVSFLVICAGSFDLMAEVMCRDNRQLLEVTSTIRNIPGVFSTETFIYYSIVKEIFDLGTL
ncbi:MAG: AsnC family transcriptional regulator, partial [Gammaproteobacteria bacterium]|nr:AsnC family transcriptional regulator [Gammaproteobacteria bacterium]NIW95327.1 AsnC family transcriptional regulator [Phycisphaerae bacterium]